MKKILIIVVVLALIGGGAYFYFSKSAATDATAEGGEHGGAASAHGETADGHSTGSNSVYSSLDPPLIVNVKDTASGIRFLQVSMEVLTEDQTEADAVKKHMPAIRNSLVMLLSSQPYSDLISSEGKEKIRASALDEIRKILDSNGAGKKIQALFFTGFVMQ